MQRPIRSLRTRKSAALAAPQLGLVCITRSDELRYRTITRKRLLALPKAEAPDVLLALYRINLDTLGRAPDYCRALNTQLYRIPSSIFPFADEPIGIALLDELADELAAVGQRFRGLGIRAVMHPDQYVVLNSDSPEVVANSIKVLTMHARVVDALNLPANPWTALEIHGGKGNRATELVEAVRNLPDNIRQRLVLENDERTYGADQMLGICEAAGVPMVFDAHHHVCYEKLDSFEHSSIAAMTTAAAGTWPDPSWQLCHISNGREGINDRRHSDEIDVMPSAFARVPWIEIEAKAKEHAIRRLQSEWLPGLESR